MLAAIDFNDDHWFKASKVRNVWTNWMLTPETGAQLVLPNRLP